MLFSTLKWEKTEQLCINTVGNIAKIFWTIAKLDGVLANYSFVQLYTEDAQTAIDKLNGYDYRGRKLVVSYSNQKSKTEDETSFDSDSEYDNYSDGYYEDESMAQEDAAAYAAAEKAASDKEPFSSFGSSVDSE